MGKLRLIPALLGVRTYALLFALPVAIAIWSAQAIAADDCAVADAYLASGGFDDAKAAYLDVLKRDASLTCAAKGLKDVADARAASAWVAIRSLSRAGFHDEAASALKEAIKANPNATVPTDLSAFMDRPVPAFAQIVDQGVHLAQDVLLALPIVVVAAAVWAYALSRRRETLRVSPFDIAFQEKDTEKDTKLGVAVAALVSERITRLVHESGGTQARMVDASAGTFNLTTALAEIPQAKLLTPLFEAIDKTLPSRARTLTGTLDVVAGDGPGVTLAITDSHGNVRAQVAIWTKTFATVDPNAKAGELATWYPLVDAIAVWTLFAAQRPSRHETLGTTDWQSYAYFANGARAHPQAPRKEANEARDWYAKALKADPNNRGAVFNLARLDSRDAYEIGVAEKREVLDRAVERIRKIREEIQRDALIGRSYEDDPLWYWATYELAISYLNIDPDLAGPEVIDKPERVARELLNAIERALAPSPRRRLARIWWRFRRRPAPDSSTFALFLSKLEPGAVALLASCLKKSGTNTADAAPPLKSRDDLTRFLNTGERADARLISYLSDDASVSQVGHYNIACYHARVGTPASLVIGLRHYLWALETLGEEPGKWAGEKDPAIKPVLEYRARKGTLAAPPPGQVF
jgi:tetratricopeptide (TPR) repeat protein